MITQVINSRTPETLYIQYMIGNLCNYKCTYCFPGSNEGDYPWPDVDLVIKNLDHLISTYKQQGKTKFEFYILGGEPTIWKDLPVLCKHLKENYNTVIRISTNGSRSINWWARNIEYFDSIEISVHHEFCKVDHIKAVGDLIYARNTNVVGNVLMDPSNFTRCQAIIEELKTSNSAWPVISKVVHIDGQVLYNDSEKEYFIDPIKRWPNMDWWHDLPNHEYNEVWVIEDGEKKLVKENWFALNDKNRFKGWSCSLGVDYFEIYQDGTIRGTCQQPIYNTLIKFSIYDPNFVYKFFPKISPVKCGKELCVCAGETTIDKRVIPIQIV